MDIDVSPRRLDHHRASYALYGVLIVGVLISFFILAPMMMADKWPIPVARTPIDWIFAGVSIGFFTNLFAKKMFGGIRTVCREWYERTWTGRDAVLWTPAPNILQMEIQSRRLRNKLHDKPICGWVLYIPLGGWFNRPELFYTRHGRSQNLRIRKVQFGEYNVDSVRIQTLSGDGFPLDPLTLLQWLNVCCPVGESNINMPNAFSSMLRDTLAHASDAEQGLLKKLDRAHVDIWACGKDTANLRQDLAKCRDTAVRSLDVIHESINRLSKCGRIKNIKEYLTEKEREIRATAPQYVIDKVLQDHCSDVNY